MQQPGPLGRPVGGGQRQRRGAGDGRTDGEHQGRGGELHPGEGERVGLPGGPGAGHHQDVDGARHGGAEDEQVTPVRHLEAPLAGEQGDAEHREDGREREGARQPGPAHGALGERREDHGEADDQPGVGDRGEHRAVRLQQEDPAEDQPEHRPAEPLPPPEPAQRPPGGEPEQRQHQPEPQHQHGEHGVGRRDPVHREEAGAPDHGHQQDGQVADDRRGGAHGWVSLRGVRVGRRIPYGVGRISCARSGARHPRAPRRVRSTAFGPRPGRRAPSSTRSVAGGGGGAGPEAWGCCDHLGCREGETCRLPATAWPSGRSTSSTGTPQPAAAQSDLGGPGADGGAGALPYAPAAADTQTLSTDEHGNPELP